MLLPHGYDGAASEHSSCRVERFLQMTDSKETQPDGDDVNMQVINPTTSAQYFHALRRQIVRNYRKPLVIVGPKILLRLSDAASKWDEFGPGTHFLPVIGDKEVNAGEVKRVILCSGKHYYALKNERKQRNDAHTAVIRVESLCPFPTHQLGEELDKYKQAKGSLGIRKKNCTEETYYFSFYLEPRRTSKHGVLEFCQATIREHARQEDQVQWKV